MNPTIQPHPYGYYEQFIGVPTEKERIASLTECGDTIPLGYHPITTEPPKDGSGRTIPGYSSEAFFEVVRETEQVFDEVKAKNGPIRIYFAASFHRQAEVRGCRDELLGILNGLPNIDPLPYFVHGDKYVVKPVTFESCSAWLDEGSQDGTEHHSPAITDPAGPAFHGGVLFKCIEAIKLCDVFIAFTDPAGTKSRGGRHIEMGAAIAMGKTIIIVGLIESGGYAIQFGDGVPDEVRVKFRTIANWDAEFVAWFITGYAINRGRA